MHKLKKYLQQYKKLIVLICIVMVPVVIYVFRSSVRDTILPYYTKIIPNRNMQSIANDEFNKVRKSIENVTGTIDNTESPYCDKSLANNFSTEVYCGYIFSKKYSKEETTAVLVDKLKSVHNDLKSNGWNIDKSSELTGNDALVKLHSSNPDFGKVSYSNVSYSKDTGGLSCNMSFTIIDNIIYVYYCSKTYDYFGKPTFN